jgi:hypothetical protein
MWLRSGARSPALDRLRDHVDLPVVSDRAREELQKAIAIISKVLDDLT